MLATAAAVESTTGKKAAMKIRKIAGGSPMPSQRMANGIHASGDRLRKKFTSGSSAARAVAECPSSRPAGMPMAVAEQEAGADAEQRRQRVLHQAAAHELGRPARAPRHPGAETATAGTACSDATAAHTATIRTGPTRPSNGTDRRGVRTTLEPGEYATRARRRSDSVSMARD